MTVNFNTTSGKWSVAGTLVLAATLCFGLTGCTKLGNLRGERFHDNSMGETVRQARPAPSKKTQDFWSFSNKGRQIEEDFSSQ